MNGLMKNFNIDECYAKDKLAQEFIKSVNPYRAKPSLGIDLRQLAKYAKEAGKSGRTISESEILRFKIQ